MNGTKDEVPITTASGNQVTVQFNNGFPVFDEWSAVNMKLPEKYWFYSDARQFRYLNKQLYKRTQQDPKLKSQFTAEELERLKNGDDVQRFTWHHHQDPGKIQLVLTEVHGEVRHTGGREIWGGGRDGRFGRLDPSKDN